MPETVANLCITYRVSFEQLVDRSGLDQQRVQAILQARWTPSPSERQRIASVFGVKVDEIIWGHATPIQHLYGHGPG